MRLTLGILIAAAALSLAGLSSSSCSGGGGGGGTGGGGGSGGGAAGGSTAGGSTAGGSNGGGSAGGSAGGTVEVADADAGYCDAGTITTECPTFDDRSAPDAGRVVEFGTVNGLAAVPQCMQVKKGQTVTFNSGAFHPIVQDCGPVNRKVTGPESAMTNITFGVAGDYGYHCDIHFFTGVVRVVP